MYEQIMTKENYDKLLASGMFWEFHPELTGNWEVDSENFKLNTMYEKEFIEWIKFHCQTTLQEKGGLFDMYWYLTKDIHFWDDEPDRFFNTEELYCHWCENEAEK